MALATFGAHAQTPVAAPGAGSVVVLETAKGIIEFETYPDTAPKAVAHILALVQKRFYAGLRFHRVVPSFVIQIGDPTTRDFTKKETWGSYSSGTPVGVSELSRTRKHVAGTVSLAHLGDAPGYGRAAERTLEYFAGSITHHPSGHCAMLFALEEWLDRLQ